MSRCLGRRASGFGGGDFGFVLLADLIAAVIAQYLLDALGGRLLDDAVAKNAGRNARPVRRLGTVDRREGRHDARLGGRVERGRGVPEGDRSAGKAVEAEGKLATREVGARADEVVLQRVWVIDAQLP